MKKSYNLLPLVIFFLFSCSSSPSSSSSLKAEYIQRRQGEHTIQLEPIQLVKKELYPWQKEKTGLYPKITKEFFRCKGSQLNSVRLMQKEKETTRYYDCGGTQKHSLPLKDQKEFIYPILIDLLNYLQTKSGKRVVITCGHCCPEHNLYLDPSASNQTSKHLLGAEVDFYIQEMEQQPQQVVQWILEYYQIHTKYRGLKEFEEFTRYEKENLNLQILPWMNKEIFLKIYTKEEKRDFDNRHPYPYISIQVRYDWDLQEKVSYSWQQAFYHLHRL